MRIVFNRASTGACAVPLATLSLVASTRCLSNGSISIDFVLQYHFNGRDLWPDVLCSLTNIGCDCSLGSDLGIYTVLDEINLPPFEVDLVRYAALLYTFKNLSFHLSFLPSSAWLRLGPGIEWFNLHRPFCPQHKQTFYYMLLFHERELGLRYIINVIHNVFMFSILLQILSKTKNNCNFAKMLPCRSIIEPPLGIKTHTVLIWMDAPYHKRMIAD